MILLMKCLNEENVAERVMDNIKDEDWVSRIIVVDGCSTDYTAHILKRYDKVEIYFHPWLDWYHDMEVLQSNIALSYVPHGEVCFILDFDEKVTDDLKGYLKMIAERGMPEGADVGAVPRQTWDLMRYEDPYPSPFAILGGDGWPVTTHQTGQYPDYQTRVIKRNPSMHWINSPHHMLQGVYKTVRFPEGCDIIHYEKDDYRDRERIEKKWLRAQARRKELGLLPDSFETKVRPDWGQYVDPRYWRF